MWMEEGWVTCQEAGDAAAAVVVVVLVVVDAEVAGVGPKVDREVVELEENNYSAEIDEKRMKEEEGEEEGEREESCFLSLSKQNQDEKWRGLGGGGGTRRAGEGSDDQILLSFEHFLLLVDCPLLSLVDYDLYYQR
jgi:hypothetical protein